MKKYRIDVVVNTAQAEAAVTRQAQGFVRVEKAALKAADAQEKAAKRVADITDRYLRKEYEDRVRFEARKQRDAERAADATARAQERAAERAAKAQEREAARLAAVQDRYLKKEYNARVRLEAQKQKAAEASAAAAGQFAMRVAELAGGAGALSFIREAFEKAADSAYNAQKMVKDYREALLELAALKGDAGKTTQAVKQDLEFRAQTLQTQQQAIDFQKAFLGVGESAIDKPGMPGVITQAEADRLKVRAGQFQAAEGGSATTHGRLAGTLLNLAGGRTDADKVFREEQQLYRIFKPGGFEFSSGAEQYGKLAPLIKADVVGKMDAAALLSAYSVNNPLGAGEDVERFIRGTAGGLGKMRGAAIEGGEKQAEYLRRLGATNQMTPVQIGKLISRDLSNQEIGSAQGGRAFNAYDYLMHHGYTEEETRKSLLGFHGMNRTGAFTNQFEVLARPEALPTAAEAARPIEDFRRDPLGQERAAKTAEETATAARGVGAQEYKATLDRMIFAKLKAEGRASGEFESYGKGWSPYAFAESWTLRAERDKYLQEERHRVGLPGKDFGGLATYSAKGEADFYFANALETARAGGNPLPGTGEIADLLRQQIAATQELADAMKDKTAPIAPPAPMRGAPGAGAGR
jgi:hypothetical protein